MTFTFLDMAGKVLFLRDDAEAAQWTVEEMSLDMDFPLDNDKVIAIGQRVYFKDPTGNDQIYEIKQPRTYEPEAYQQVHAENIVISELSDEHTDNVEITKQNCKAVLTSLLSGTGWSVGTVEINPVSTLDISRGSVWQGVLQIKDAFNVDIVPNITMNANGTITRKLDILNPKGSFQGLRLSVDKNMIDPCVAYDDSEVATALFGYGGVIQGENPDEQTECNFADVTWTKTADHPAKPKGQKYLEDKEATAAYGRNGRPRYGFYQNSDITDPEELLEKTWETLKTTRVPALSIEGTVADLHRLGYADVPLKLRDIALVEINPFGFKTSLQVIKMTVDLLDPTGTVVTIGAYIPNIIYIERKTNENATGSRGGGGGNKGTETTWQEFRTTIQAYADGTGLAIRAVQNDVNNQKEEVAKRFGEIEVTYENIRLEVNDLEEGVNAKINVLKNQISLVVTDEKNPKIKPASIVAAINNGASSVKISADHVEVDGILDALELWTGNIACDKLYPQTIVCPEGNISAGQFEGDLDAEMVDISLGLTFKGHDVSWKSFTYTDVTLSGSQFFLYTNSSSGTTPYGSRAGKIVTASENKTIYYMGR